MVFATGTPVSNSMTEMYTMMRYLQYGTLKAKELTHFDCWASTFGQTTTSIELAPEGTGYRARTRFAKFFNLPELMSIFKEVADVKTHDQMDLDVPDAEFETVLVKPSELQKEMVAALSERAAAVHAGQVDPSEDNMLKITSDGRKIGLDQRLMNSMLPDDAGSKLNACVENVFRIWEEGKEGRLIQYFPLQIEKQKGFIRGYEKDMETAKAHPVPEEGFRGMEIKGSTFSEKKDAGEVLLSVCKQYKGEQAEVIGTYRGFQMELSFDAFDRAYKVALKGQMTHSVTLGQDGFGNITRLDNAIAGIEKRPQGAKDHLGTLLHDQANAQAEVGKPFPQEEELRVKAARLAELDTLLNMDEQGAEPIAGEEYGSMEEQEVKPSINDALLGPDPPHEAKEKKHEEVVL